MVTAAGVKYDQPPASQPFNISKQMEVDIAHHMCLLSAARLALLIMSTLHDLFHMIIEL